MVTVTLIKDKTTVRTVRYAEVPDSTGEPIIGTLYVKKSALDRLGHPDSIVVSIIPGEAGK